MQEAFDTLKRKFTKALILATHNLEKDMVLKTNASNSVISKYLSQKGKDGLLHPVAYYLRKLTKAKLNYNVHNKELLAIINTMEY
jgi:hypothetical protein